MCYPHNTHRTICVQVGIITDENEDLVIVCFKKVVTGWGCGSGVQRLPSTREALGSIPSTTYIQKSKLTK